MTNPTSNFGWQMPQSVDLVTDLPADFEVFGQAVDTDFVDLLGGTTGQVLSKTSNTDLDFTWVAANPGDITGVTAGTGITGGGTSGTVTVTNDMATTITAAGDIVVGTGSGTYDNLPIGTTNQILTADTTVSPYKVKWATPAAAASGMTLINRTTYTAAASISVDSVFSATYSTYLVVFEDVFSATGSTQQMYLKLRYAGPTTETGGYYGNVLTTQHFNTTITNTPSSGTAYLIAAAAIGSASEQGRGAFLFQGVGNSSQLACITGNYRSTAANNQNAFSGGPSVARTYLGFQVVTASAANLEGTIAVYGLAEA